MAQAVQKAKWLAIEEAMCREAYWNLLIDGWFQRIPYVLTALPAGERRDGREAPSADALRHFGWVKEPQSLGSH